MKATDISRPPRGGRGLKSVMALPTPPAMESPPSRGAWIEIQCQRPWEPPVFVAPRAGGVD